LDRCRQLKKQWVHALRRKAQGKVFNENGVRHPRSPELRATVVENNLAQPIWRAAFSDRVRSLAPPRCSACGGRRPHVCRHLARITGRRTGNHALVWGRWAKQPGNADTAGLSLSMVKKHLHGIFESSKSRAAANSWR